MSYQICKNSIQGIFHVASDSADKQYIVDFRQVPPTCTCVSYAIRRNRAGGKNHGGAAICKHIERAYDMKCDFDSRKHGESMIPVCPHCGRGLTVVDEQGSLAEESSPANISAEPTAVGSGDAVLGNTSSLLAKLGTQLGENSSFEDSLLSFEDKVIAAKPEFVALIEKVTGWSKVEVLADLIVHTIINNEGNAVSAPLRIRCGCGDRPFDEHGKLRPRWLNDTNSIQIPIPKEHP